MTQQVTAAQQMLELPEEDFNRPTVSVQERDDLGGNVEQVCRNSQEAIAIDTR
jgi:nitrogen fixation protein